MTDLYDQALARVRAKSSPASAPAVEDATVEAFLKAAGFTDSQGRRPGDEGWDGPWDENLAIAEVWASKAAAVSGWFNFSADGASYNKGDMLSNFLELESRYRAMSGAGNGLGTTTIRGTNDTNTLDTIAAQVIP